ncbi:tape measure protein [Ensifer sp. NBAIM29]|nr:tape measure protein [Ensifer sp. NBAIM29]
MKFMMIFEGVDRTTKVMNKIMSADKKAARSVKAGARANAAAASASARASQKQASALAKIGSAAKAAYGAIVSSAQAAARATAKLHQETLKLGRSGLDRVGAGAGKTFRGLALGAGLAASAVGSSALAAGQLVDVASQFESYNIQLATLEGSAAKGQKAMAWVTKFAVETPLELDQVVESYRSLKTFGLDPTNGTLQALVDTMAASGKGAEQLEGLTLALGQAWTKGKLQGEEALQLLERGVPVWDILSQKYGKTAAELQEMASKGKLGREAIQVLIDEMGRRNAGASADMARTWKGMVSNISDVWTQFQLAIMNAGLFDWMKGKLQVLLDTINTMKADGSLDVWARRISDDIIFVLESAWQFGKGVWEVMKTLGGYLKMAADYLGGGENLAMVLAGLAFAPTLIATAAGLVQIAMGLSMLGTALMANPIVLVIAAIIAGAVAIYANWDGIAAFFGSIWNNISAAAAAAYNTLADILGFDLMAALSRGWSALSSFVANAWASLPSLHWSTIVSAFSWTNVLTVLNWASWLSPLRWLDVIPGFSWSGIITTALDWGQYIASLDWTQYIPSFSWPELPDFEWPELPGLELPELPDITGWVGNLGDKIGNALGGIASRAGEAWAKVKSVFTFGDDSDLSIDVTEPKTIQATAAATAALKADMQAVAGIDTSEAMNRLTALETAARDIGAAVTSAIRRAQAYLANVSFYDQGAALMDTMAAGMRARASVVIAEIQKMTQTIRDHLPSSPAKVGPLSDIHRLKFGETIAGSIRAEPMVKAMRAAAAATMGAAAITAPALASDNGRADTARAAVARLQVSAQSERSEGQGSRAPIIYSPTITVAGATAKDKEDFRQMLREHSREIASLMEEEERRDSRRKV